MKKSLLLTALCTAVVGLSASAAVPVVAVESAKAVNHTQSVKPRKVVNLDKISVVESRKLSDNAQLQICQDINGRKFKRLVSPSAVNKKINFAAPMRENSNSAFLEGFEASTGDMSWQPEGWTVESKVQAQIATPEDSWFVYSSTPYAPKTIGSYYEEILFSSDERDEWLISPLTSVPEDCVLSFYAYFEAFYFYNLDYIDWDTGVFSEYKEISNFEVYVKEEGAEKWDLLVNFFEEYKKYDGFELLQQGDYTLKNFTYSLKQYTGKKIQVAFRYSGIDGNSVFVDEVMIGQPKLEVKYSHPLGAMFFGVSEDFIGLNLGIAYAPVFTPLTWMNETENYDASFSWMYHDPVTNDWAASTERDLTVTYAPDYSSDFTKRNNLYYTPILTGNAEGFSEGSMTSLDYIQAGGRGEFEFSNSQTGEKLVKQLGVTVFDLNSEGFDVFYATDQNNDNVALYGYNEYTDKYWTDYTFQGGEEPGDGVKLTALINYHFSTGAPVVIEGARMLGKGIISDNAEFKLEIIGLTEDGLLENVLASAVCKGSEVDLGLRDDGFLSIPFKFEKPIVIDENESTFITRFSGFNDPENVTLFVPFQSSVDAPSGYALGWIAKEITMDGNTRESLTPTAYYTGYHSFAIVLDACYPWLTADADEVVISKEGVAEVSLGSYYDASKLSVGALPEWLNVELSGRYDQAKAVFTATGSEPGNCVVTINGDGVSKELSVSYDGTASVITIEGDASAEVTGICNLAGQTFGKDAKLAPGVYVVRYSDGTTAKKVVK